MRQHSLEAAVRAAGIDAPPVFTEETGSTSTDAMQLAEEGAPEWTVVATNHQNMGRGRLGRSWSSVPGKLLQFSVVLRPQLAAEQLPLLSFLAATEVVEVASSVCGKAVQTKWPNDIVIGERKVAGILPEASLAEEVVRYVVIGVGMNLTMQSEDFPQEIRGSATSLALEGASTVDDAEILQELLRGLNDAYKPWSPSFAEAIVHGYELHCATLGRRVSATTTGGDVIEGTAVRLGPLGELVVESGGSERSVVFGEVAHLTG